MRGSHHVLHCTTMSLCFCLSLYGKFFSAPSLFNLSAASYFAVQIRSKSPAWFAGRCELGFCGPVGSPALTRRSPGAPLPTGGLFRLMQTPFTGTVAVL